MLTTLTTVTTIYCYFNIINGLQCSRYPDYLVANLLPTTKNLICSKVVCVASYYCCKLKKLVFVFKSELNTCQIKG